jgi:putative ABC transport system permease protein
MSRDVRPPRWAEWLLSALPEGLSRDGVAGDLEEELQARAARGSRFGARLWYARQALAIAARSIVGRLARSSGENPSLQRNAALGTRLAYEGGFLSTLASSFGQAARSLRHAPSFVLLTVITLAVGVGATTAIFSVVDGILLRPLPYPRPDELVVLTNTHNGDETYNFSEPELYDLMAMDGTFAAVSAYRTSRPLLGGVEEPTRLQAVLATSSFFDVLGVQPLLGRSYTADEDRSDAADRVAVLAHSLWAQAFASDPDIIGKSVLFENLPTTVIGVMPPGFSFPRPGIEVYRPLRLDRANPIARNNHYLAVIARRAEGVTPETAAAALDALGVQSTASYPEFYGQAMTFRAPPMLGDLVESVRSPILLLMAAVVGMLLIAAVNAAGLFLARAETRRGEIAVRTALGAGQGRVAGQLMAESLVVAALAAGLGSAFAWAMVKALARLAPANTPRIEQIGVDARILSFGIVVALATGLLFGAAPALQAWRGDVRNVLAAAGRSGIGSRGAGRFRRGLVVTQLALATMLAVGAALIVRSFATLRQVELGFSPAGVLTVPLAPHASQVAANEPAIQFYRELEERVAALPGVVSVGSALRIPLADGHDNYSIQVEGREVATIGESPSPGMEWATPGYFEALQIPLVRGRYFTAADDASAPLVAVIGEGTANELWPGEDALGKRLRLFNPSAPWMEVIGVVADVKHYGVRADRSAKLYIPHLQGYLGGTYSPPSLSLFVRTDGDPAALAPPIREVVTTMRPGIPIGAVRTMDEIVGTALAADRFTLLLLSGFAVGALLLAAVGVYGVVAETVNRRTREIGLRMAVGADRRRILRQVLKDGVVLASAGAMIGVVGGVLSGDLMRSLLYEVSPSDPWTYVAVGPLLVGVTLLASLIPALRAARVDPVEALRGG